MELSAEVKGKFERIAKEVVRAEAEEVDRQAVWPERSMRALQAEGLAGLTVPQEFGGIGGGLLSVVEACEILGKECGSLAMCFGMHSVGSAVIAAKAKDDQAEKFLKPIAEGRHITTLSLSEPGTGSHFYIPELKMTETSDGNFELNGEKSFVTNGSYADSYVVSAVGQQAESPMGEFSMLVVPSDSKGLQWKEPWRGLGMRGNASTDAAYKGVKVAKQNLLGQEGDQIWYVFEVVAPYFLLAMSGTYLGIARCALIEAIDHLKKRSYSFSGTGLVNVGVLQHRVGQLWSRLESARQLTFHAARLGDAQNADALPAILSAKAEVGDAVTLVTNEVLTLMGGKGYGEAGKLGRLLRDARAAHVMAPTTDMLRTWTGRALMDAPLLGEG